MKRRKGCSYVNVCSFRLCLTFVEVVILAYKTLFSGLQIKNFTRRQLFAAQRTSKATKVVHFITCFANKVLVVNLFATPPTFGPKTPEKRKRFQMYILFVFVCSSYYFGICIILYRFVLFSCQSVHTALSLHADFPADITKLELFRGIFFCRCC